MNWCDFRFELDGPQVRRAIAQFSAKIGATLRRNIAPVKPPEPPPAPPHRPPVTEPRLAPPRPPPIIEPDNPRPPPATVFDAVEPPNVRGERRVSFPKVNYGSLCGLALMFQGLIMFVGLLGANPFITNIVLIIAAAGSIVAGFRVARQQSTQSVRLALYASLIGLLVCFVFTIGAARLIPAITDPLTLDPRIHDFTVLTGIVLFGVSAILAGLELRRVRAHQPSTKFKTSITTIRRLLGHPEFRSLSRTTSYLSGPHNCPFSLRFPTLLYDPTVQIHFSASSCAW